jgi:hypothetical protein
LTDPTELARLLGSDVFAFQRALWPDVKFYDRQWELILSVEQDAVETYCVAAHQVGKDFVAAFVALRFFLKWGPPDTVRVVTTSVKDDHLRVLWGEIGRYLDTAAVPLTRDRGGPLVVNHREIRKVRQSAGRLDKISYLIGTVSERGEGLAGHHAKHTLLIVDEASGVDDVVYERSSTWAKRCLIFGNPYTPPGGTNFFKRAVEAGDVLMPEEGT